MGFMYVKVIEARKVAQRSSFYVNYPFIRLNLNGKDIRNTNFRAGIEWWDKIFCFKLYKFNSADQYMLVQARDKSIHVFGSDWLGETKIYTTDFYDGKVHQKWFKLGRGRNYHSRIGKGYVHLAFHYFENSSDVNIRPFSQLPVEPVQTFDEYLAQTENTWSVDKKYNEGKIKSKIIEESTTSSTEKDSSLDSDPKSSSKRENSKSSDTVNSKSIRGSNEDLSSTKRSFGSSDSLENDSLASDSDVIEGNLIDLDGFATIRSDIDGMFPPFLQESSYILSSPTNLLNTPLTEEEKILENNSKEDNCAVEYKSRYTGKNPFLTSNDPFAALSISDAY